VVARVKTRWEDEPLVSAGDSSAPARSATEQERIGSGALALDSACACGHTRLDHTGLRMEVIGRCLQCACQEFECAAQPTDDDEETMARIRAAIEKAERMQRVAAELLAASRG
jgi:hypothetical protein